MLGIPDEYVLDNSSRISGIEAFVITLNRLVYPNRLRDMVGTFARSHSMLSRVFNHVLDFLYEKHKQKLSDLRHNYVDYQKIAAIIGKRCPLQNCIGFIERYSATYVPPYLRPES